MRERAPIRAYHAWTPLDNFEWSESYTQRPGLGYTHFGMGRGR